MTEEVSVIRLNSLDYPTIYHWGILVKNAKGEEYIYHNQSDKFNNFGGNIVKEDYNEVKKRGYYLFDKTPINMTESEVESKTQSLIRQKYNVLYFNCRDYVKRVWSKIPEGQEKYVIAGAIGVGIVLVAGIIIGIRLMKKHK